APLKGPPARYASPLVFDPLRGEVVVSGGHDCSDVFSDTWVWDGTNWTQRTPANLPTPRYRHSLEFDPSRGTVVMYGGIPGATGVADTWEWDGNEWTHLPTITLPPTLGSLAFDAARNVLCWYADRRA